MTPGTIAAVLDSAAPAYADLEALGATIEDEWQYVTDLAAAWRGRLAAVAAARGAELAPAGACEAVAALAEEASLVDDPHRAIDWLSTYPQVVLAALGEAG